MTLDTKIFVAGHNGMVGSAIVRKLESAGCKNIVTASRSELNLLDQSAVNEFFEESKVEQVYLAAAKVGGIHANNTYPAEFLYENIMLQTNIIHAAHENNVERLLFLGSSCIYPKDVPQPMREDALLTGLLEPTNEPYAIAKIAGIKLCESYNRQYDSDFRSIMPCNLYGQNDNFHPENSHVIPALMRRFHEAVENKLEEVVIWGSGTPLREFMHVDDMAAASLHVMMLTKEKYREHTLPSQGHINAGTGAECSIRELAETIARVTGFSGAVSFDTSKPDGTARKLMDVCKLRNAGWNSELSLEDGLKQTYQWYTKNVSITRS